MYCYQVHDSDNNLVTVNGVDLTQVLDPGVQPFQDEGKTITDAVISQSFGNGCGIYIWSWLRQDLCSLSLWLTLSTIVASFRSFVSTSSCDTLRYFSAAGMPCPLHIIKAFEIASQNGDPIKAEYYLPYSHLLMYLFPQEENFVVHPQHSRREVELYRLHSHLRYTAPDKPVFFLEVMPGGVYSQPSRP